MKASTTAVVYTYGTLRPGGPDTVQIPGDIYEIGWYPGAILKGADYPNTFTAERVEIPAANLELLDNYEGYREERPGSSLFIRVPYLDGWLYTYNKGVEGRKRIESGDFLKHMGQTVGVAAQRMGNVNAGKPCQTTPEPEASAVEEEEPVDEEVRA